MANSTSEVFLLKTTDRATGVPALIKKIGLDDYSGKQVALKANYNSADPFPASTHLDTLRALIENLKGAGASEITLAERSGMGTTEKVLEEMGVLALSKELGFKAVVLDDVGKEDWLKVERKDTHWVKGFYMAKVFHDADKVVQTCCLKTHRFGGHFTLSMKNSVGLVAKKVPGGMYDYMWELHGSPFQRQMIAEINNNYKLDFVLMDGIKAFITGGPEQGKIVEPNLLLASRDRVAIDAVGVAILKMYGAKGKVGEADVFEQDQLKRAAELGFGVKSAAEIQLTPLNDEGRVESERIEKILKAQVAMH
jgi:uncharacterized protein (DUF362 family)